MKHDRTLTDISVPLQTQMPTWPGSRGLKLLQVQRLKDGDVSNVSQLICDVHVGTHVDAPLHFVENGRSVEQLPLDCLIGPATVAQLSCTDRIASLDLDRLQLDLPIERLLLKTKNSDLWAMGNNSFCEDFVALTPDAAQWVVEHKIRLVGIDYLSIQCYGDGPETHRTLLDAGVIVVEGLDLSRVMPGRYELLCMPLKLIGAEGAPARAVLRDLHNKCTRNAS